MLCPTSQRLESRKKATPQPHGLTQEGTVARGANPEDKPASGGRHSGVQLTGLPAAPATSCQTKVVMGSLMPLEVHLVGVKMVGVRSAHPHPHLNPYLCASFLLPPPQKKSCGDVEWWWAQAKDVAGSV